METDYGHKISVVVPVYRVEPYLNACVSSIVGQTYENLEIILVDDGSPDSCPAMCDDWAKRDPRIRVIHQTNGGLSEARNTGIAVASGDYLLFVDSDDWLEPTACADALRELTQSQADIAVFGFTMIEDETNRILSQRRMEPGVVSGVEAINLLLEAKIDNYAWNKLYKRELFAGITYPKGFLWEDIGTTYRVFARAKRICVFPKSEYAYRQRSTNITGTIGLKGLRDIFLLRLKQYEDLETVESVNRELGFSQLVENAFYFYNRTLSESCDADSVERVKAFLEEKKQRICQDSRYALYYRARVLYNAKYRLRYGAKKLLKR